ncbi:hypothetical protein EG328_003839 [Venturia inaequalis]|uniref:Uncharacterized protein n=1 Tax=Venturia inaequalis TaxID=5025 RepID=A0A8H3UKG3_VENIN|nr:hypothetical protein EG327_010309 [Venturia inaequalis]KAE9987057.1 hypothetical protein EG328_003839 [Venturia inaequalis]RDI80281.1 hypothetical protein Vi05172_g9744 [Venturia inaequalis]
MIQPNPILLFVLLLAMLGLVTSHPLSERADTVNISVCHKINFNECENMTLEVDQCYNVKDIHSLKLDFEDVHVLCTVYNRTDCIFAEMSVPENPPDHFEVREDVADFAPIFEDHQRELKSIKCRVAPTSPS